MSAPSPVRRFSIRTRTRSAHWAECSGRGGTMPATLPRCAHSPGSAWGRDGGAAALPVWVRFRPVASAIPASPVPGVRAQCAATPSSTGHIPRRSASDCRGYNTRNWPSRSYGAVPRRGPRVVPPRFSHPPLPVVVPDSSHVALYGVIHPYENAPEKIYLAFFCILFVLARYGNYRFFPAPFFAPLFQVFYLAGMLLLLKKSFIDQIEGQFQVKLVKFNHLICREAFLLPACGTPVNLDMLFLLAYKGHLLRVAWAVASQRPRGKRPRTRPAAVAGHPQEVALLRFGLRIANRTLKWFVMQDAGGAFEEAVDVAAPLREERAVAEIFHVRVERSPDVGEHILVGMLDAALYARGDAAGMLANNIQSLENTLS